MTARFSIVSASLIAAALLGAAQAQAAARNFPVARFDRIQSNVPFGVRVHTGAVPSVRAQGPQEALDRLVVEVSNGELVIRSRRGNWWSGWNWRRERAIWGHWHYPLASIPALVWEAGLELVAVRGQRAAAHLEPDADEDRHRKAVFLARRASPEIPSDLSEGR